MTGPYRIAMTPAAAVMMPPKKKRIADSWGFVDWRESSFTSTIIRFYLSAVT
jgi:hypothetical protein